MVPKNTICIWYDKDAESAAKLRRTASLLTAFMVLNSADKAESLVFSIGY